MNFVEQIGFLIENQGRHYKREVGSRTFTQFIWNVAEPSSVIEMCSYMGIVAEKCRIVPRSNTQSVNAIKMTVAIPFVEGSVVGYSTKLSIAFSKLSGDLGKRMGLEGVIKHFELRSFNGAKELKNRASKMERAYLGIRGWDVSNHTIDCNPEYVELIMMIDFTSFVYKTNFWDKRSYYENKMFPKDEAKILFGSKPSKCPTLTNFFDALRVPIKFSDGSSIQVVANGESREHSVYSYEKLKLVSTPPSRESQFINAITRVKNSKEWDLLIESELFRTCTSEEASKPFVEAVQG